MEDIKPKSPKDRLEKEEIMEILDIASEKADELIRNPFFPSIPIGRKLHIVPRTAFVEWYTKPENIISYKKNYMKKNTTNPNSTMSKTDSVKVNN